MQSLASDKNDRALCASAQGTSPWTHKQTPALPSPELQTLVELNSAIPHSGTGAGIQRFSSGKTWFPAQFVFCVVLTIIFVFLFFLFVFLFFAWPWLGE
jgi:hypothetical protein